MKHTFGNVALVLGALVAGTFIGMAGTHVNMRSYAADAAPAAEPAAAPASPPRMVMVSSGYDDQGPSWYILRDTTTGWDYLVTRVASGTAVVKLDN